MRTLLKKLFGPSLEERFLQKLHEADLEDFQRWHASLLDLMDDAYDLDLQYLRETGANVEEFDDRYIVVSALSGQEAQDVGDIAAEYDITKQYLAASERIRQHIDSLDPTDPASVEELAHIEQTIQRLYGHDHNVAPRKASGVYKVNQVK